MLVREIMRPGVFTIGETDCLGNAYRAMQRSSIRHLPVISDGELVGMVSERDILAARARSDETDWSQLTVRSAMQAPAQWASPEVRIDDIAARMAAGRFGAMPIVELGKLVGIVTTTDILASTVSSRARPSSVVEVMSPHPFVIAPEQDLGSAIRQMTKHEVRHLPVVAKGGTLIGMLSEANIRTAVGDPARFVEEQRFATLHPRVQDVMTPTTDSIEHDRPVAALAKRFADEKLEALAVVDPFGAVIGVVSYVDLLRVIAN